MKAIQNLEKKLGFSFKGVEKVLFYALLLFGLYILQAMIFTHLPIFGVKPLLLPVAVMCVALFEGTAGGGAFGLFAGILCDMSFNQPAIQFTLFLTLLGLSAGYLFDTVLSTSMPAFIVCTVISLVISAAVQAFPTIVYGNADMLTVLQVMLIQTLYSSLFTLPLYYLIRKIAGHSRRRGEIL